MGRQSQRGLGKAGVGERGGKRGVAGLLSPYNCEPHGIAPRMRKWAHGSFNHAMNVTMSCYYTPAHVSHVSGPPAS